VMIESTDAAEGRAFAERLAEVVRAAAED